jgi:hypothetical protein
MKREARRREAAPIPVAGIMAAIDTAPAKGSVASTAVPGPAPAQRNTQTRNRDEHAHSRQGHAAAPGDDRQADKAIDEALKCFGSDPAKTEFAKEAKVLRDKIDAARRLAGPAAVKALTPLAKAAEEMGPRIFKASTDLFAKRRREELRGQVNAALAGALLDVGKISDPALTKLMFAEQAAMKARMDKAEKMKKDIDAVDEMDNLDDEMPALQQRLKSALALSAWLGSGFKSMLALAESSIASVPNSRCRDVLRAELDFVAQAKNGALVKLDAKAVEAATLPALRRCRRSRRGSRPTARRSTASWCASASW